MLFIFARLALELIFEILRPVPYAGGNTVLRNNIAIPIIDIRNGFAAVFQCTKRKTNETNGKNMQLTPHRTPARNAAMRKPTLPINNTINPDITRMVFDKLLSLWLIKLFNDDWAEPRIQSNIFFLLFFCRLAFCVANFSRLNSCISSIVSCVKF